LIRFDHLESDASRLHVDCVTAEGEIGHDLAVSAFDDRISQLIWGTLPRTMIATRTVRLQSSVGSAVFC
jgi:hypothetical protein